MTQGSDAERLRAIFDEDAERYDRARPGYPSALFDDFAELAGIGPRCRVLEIGCGTGRATVPLAGIQAKVGSSLTSASSLSRASSYWGRRRWVA